ncbi:AlpA family phage regulatory protein [Gammaproteobacteria bacterium]|nr:AlpA family phage regulatory protein [Gammaproteobacteria bacterium]
MKLLTIEDVMKLNLGKRTTLWKKVRDGKFPKPIKLGDASSRKLV